MTHLNRIHASRFAAGFAAMLLAASLVLPGTAHADTPFHRSLTIAGEGKISAVPDTANIGTGVVTEASTAKEALEANTAAMNRIFDALQEIGIERRDMQTSQFNVAPVYTQPQRNTNEAPRISGYRVTNALNIRMRDMDRIGPTLDRLVSVGSNQISGVSFDISNSRALLDKAREEAVKDALRKAKVYAASAGVVIGRILTISETGAHVPQYRMVSRAMDMAESSVPIASGEMELTANVNVVIEIE